MTNKVFWADPYCTALEATIVTVATNAVTLDRTIFYAFSGGQERDTGTIDGRLVLDAQKAGRAIIYTLEDATGLAVGDSVHVRIDWPRRYALMRLHFAAEIVLELCSQSVPTIEKIGAHIGPTKARIDFAWPASLAPFLPAIAAQAAALVAADLPITSAFSDVANERRYWAVPGFAQVACGGTHLRRTGEVGPLVLRRKKLGAGKERVEIILADAETPPSASG